MAAAQPANLVSAFFVQMVCRFPVNLCPGAPLAARKGKDTKPSPRPSWLDHQFPFRHSSNPDGIPLLAGRSTARGDVCESDRLHHWRNLAPIHPSAELLLLLGSADRRLEPGLSTQIPGRRNEVGGPGDPTGRGAIAGAEDAVAAPLPVQYAQFDLGAAASRC